jgi:hypothetical protein
MCMYGKNGKPDCSRHIPFIYLLIEKTVLGFIDCSSPLGGGGGGNPLLGAACSSFMTRWSSLVIFINVERSMFCRKLFLGSP